MTYLLFGQQLRHDLADVFIAENVRELEGVAPGLSLWSGRCLGERRLAVANSRSVIVITIHVECVHVQTGVENFSECFVDLCLCVCVWKKTKQLLR